MSELPAQVADLVAAVTHGRIAAAGLTEDASLATLESVEILELVVVLEERFAIRLEESDLAPASWKTFGQLLALVAARRGQ